MTCPAPRRRCRPTPWLGLAAAAIAATTAGSAHAQQCQPRDELSTCIASDNLWTHAGAGRWFSQAPTETVAAGAAVFSVVPTYYHRPIGLRISSPDPNGTTIFAVENALSATFAAGAGVTDRLQLGIAAPVMLFQDGAGKSDVVGSDERLPRSAVGDMRFGAQLSILRRDVEGPGLSARFEMAAPTAHQDAFAGFQSATWAPGVAFDYRIGDWQLGADLCARIRQSNLLATNVIGSQIALSIGASWDIIDGGWLSAGIESFALFGLNHQFDLDTDPSELDADILDGPPHIPLEYMLSARTAGLLDGRFVASLGGGSFIPTSDDIAVTTPTFRVALGLHYVFVANDDDGDRDRQ